MRFVNILKTVLTIGAQTLPTVLNLVTPGVGSLVGIVLQSVLTTEAKLSAAKGQDKFQASLECTQLAVPAVVQLMEQSSGKQLADEELFAQGVAEIQEGTVKVLNAFRILPKKPQ